VPTNGALGCTYETPSKFGHARLLLEDLLVGVQLQAVVPNASSPHYDLMALYGELVLK